MRDKLYEIERLLDEIRAEEINSFVESCIDDIYDEVQDLNSMIGDIDLSNNLIESVIDEFDGNPYTIKLHDEIIEETTKIAKIIE